jgi:uncharacterized protein YllA (UPF0747 family)
MAMEDHDFEEINYFNFKEGNSDGTRRAPDLSDYLPTDYLMFLNHAQGTGSSTTRNQV